MCGSVGSDLPEPVVAAVAAVAVGWPLLEVAVVPGALAAEGADGVEGAEDGCDEDGAAAAVVVAWLVVVAGPELCELPLEPFDPPSGSMYC